VIYRSTFIFLFALISFTAFAQNKWGFVSGVVRDENDQPLPGVSVVILGQQKGIVSNDSGYFRIRATAGRAFGLVFSHAGYKTTQQNFLLSEDEEERVTVIMEPGGGTLEGVVVTDQRERTEAGLIKPNPKTTIELPSPVTGVESLIKIFVGSNNELTSQYNVRGGSYDENLIYVNDFEIFRPYLVRSGQQEGLSFINAEMVRNINFYNGGFQARYGDKMSSVLDIQYNSPKEYGGSAYVSLLEQGLHFEGVGLNKKFTFVVGARNRSNRNLLSSQETQGNYVPSSADIQALIGYQFSPKWQAEMLGNISGTKFKLTPQFSQLTSSVFSPFFTANLGVDIYFEGREQDAYTTRMLGFSTTYQPVNKLKLKFLVARFENDESENIDIAGAYLFGDRDFDKSSSSFGTIVSPLGAGIFQTYARNELNITDHSFAHKGSLHKNKHFFLWGLGYNRTDIQDKLHEWEYQDSAGYSLPYNPDVLLMNRYASTKADLSINRFHGYVQDNLVFRDSASSFTLQAGLRYNYNDLNKEFLLSPRVGASWSPTWKTDVVFRVAGGAYHQPPFYRELRRYDGSLNTNVNAQKSWQAVAGMDLNFIGWGRPLKFTTETYYKSISDVVPYDIDNVRLRYFGENKAKAYATGIEMRLFGEIVKDAESWITLGIMKTKEDLEGDPYMQYTLDEDNKPVDSVEVEGGWLRRPTDRLLTLGMFFQDYLSTNKNFKVYLNTLYGSNLPYNIPGSVKYRNALRIEPYIRVDIGFSALLLDGDKSERRNRSPFRNFENLWLSLEVFNLIDRPNTISYLLIKDFANNTFTMPNRLTPRLLNFKLVGRW
jgi:hypothetical protein